MLEFATGRFVGITAGARRREPRLVGGRHADRVPARAVPLRPCPPTGGDAAGSCTRSGSIRGTTADRLAARPGRDRRASSPAGSLLAGRAGWSSGRPAFAPDGSRLAFANADGLSTIPAAGGEPVAGRAGARGVAALGAGRVRARLSRRRRAAHRRPRRRGPGPSRSPARVTAVDWQPCVDGRDHRAAARSPPPQCSALTAAATTEADVPVDLPAPPVQRPVGAAALGAAWSRRPTTARSRAGATRRPPASPGQDALDLPRQQRRRRVGADPGLDPRHAPSGARAARRSAARRRRWRRRRS